jgi:beta-phosphoglucomutase-like phosphatase (HAD superfamily)
LPWTTSPSVRPGQQVLDAATPTTPGLAEYHRAILRALGVRRPTQDLLRELEQPGAHPLVEPFPEVPGVLERLRAGGVQMAIVSDNWPGLDGLYRGLGLHNYFQAFVTSAELGCRKPDPRMYRAGSDALGLPRTSASSSMTLPTWSPRRSSSATAGRPSSAQLIHPPTSPGLAP